MTHPATVTVLSTHPAAATSTVIRKLVVEVVEARELLPKDGQGSSSPYVVVDFDGQRKRTKTIVRDLNPVWNEALEFIIVDPKTMEAEELDVEVYNDKRTSGGSRRNHFLGRVKLYGTQFARRGEEGLVYFTLEKKSVFSWIRGVLGLRIYFYDEILVVEELKQEISPPPPENEPDQLVGTAPDPPPQQYLQEPPQPENERFVCQVPSDAALETNDPPEMGSHGTAVNMVDDPPRPRPPTADPAPETVPDDHPLMHEHSPVVRRMQSCGTAHATTERVKGFRRPNGDNFAPRVIPTRFADSDRMARIPSHQLVEPMQYLFVRIVKARGLAAASENTYVKVRAGNHFARSKPAVYQLRAGEPWPEWNQVFALAHNTVGSTLEIYVWDGPADAFLGGVCFDLSDVPVRDPPDSPLAPQWYRLEGADERSRSHVSGDIMLSVWIGTQADDAFPESWNSDAQYVAHTRSKVYQSPKLWYLRVSVIEAQDLQVLHSSGPFDVRVKAQLGFQSARTRRSSSASHHSSSFSWHEDLVFVAGEPLEDQIIVLVEDRTVVKEASLLGHVIVPISKIEQRLDERNAATKWYNLDGGANGYAGRIHLRLCLEGGYHVLDEAAHVCSDFRPTAKQLWKPAVGVLELGILGARALVPMKTKGGAGAKGSTDAYCGAKGSTDAYCGAKGSTDAYCVAKYGKKWVRTRTITDSFDPRWNEQYTWQVYDPCTVLTVGVFDNWRMFGEDRPDYRIGKVRIRVSTLESNRVYTNSYPLVLLRPGGVKKMGEIEVAVRFACPSLLPDTCAVYGQPLLPRMHYLRPLGVAQQEALRGAATRMVAGWLARSEPPLGYEVVRYMLDADSHAWSMRKSKANWFRILGVLAWVVGLARWTEDVRTWRNPVTTVLVHILYLVLVWYPELIVPTGFLYVFLVGAWYYRFKPKIPAGMDVRLSQADAVDPDELDEEFDPVPSTKPADVVRARYDRLRVLAARIQTVLGDVATQGERVQALVSWRDPRATKMFMFLSLLVALVLYTVPPKMVAVALGFYFLRHPMFRDPMPPASLNFFRRLPSLSDRLI